MFRKFSAGLLAGALICPASAFATTWDAFDSFNGTATAGQFLYRGYTGPLVGQGPTLMSPDTCSYDIVCISAADASFAKAGPGTPSSLTIDDGSVVTVPYDRLVTDPGDYGAAVFFSAPTAGAYYVHAVFDGIESLNSGVGIAIFSSITSPTAVITPNTVPVGATFDGVFVLAENQFVGFYFGPGQQAYHDLTSFSFQVSDSPVDAVPEPATWALMLLGFGSLGAALRRRRTVAA